MEPRNFSSPNVTDRVTDKKREERLHQLRERRNRTLVSNGETVPREIGREMAKEFDKVRPLPNRQARGEGGRAEPREKRPEARLDARSEPKTELRPRRKAPRPNPVKSPVKFIGWQLLRLAIAGVGLSVIAGTAISFWQNQQSIAARNNTQGQNQQAIGKEELNKKNQEIVPLALKTEVTSLLTKIKDLAAKEKDLSMQMMVLELDSGAYAQVSANQPVSAASTIKTPLLVAFLQDVDAGKIKLDEQLEMTADVKVGEAGDFQFLPTGTKISALETATQMIVISDNTATNMIIKRLGGIAAVNQRFKSWGLTGTAVNNQLPDLEGMNTISSQDLVTLLAMIDQGKLVEPRSRDRFMDIMRRPITNTLLPKGIDQEARIIHKTGDIGVAVGDAGIVDMPNGKRYAIAVMVKRPDNDQRANELIRQISRATYEHFRSGGNLAAPTSPNPTNSTSPTNNVAPSPNNRPNSSPNSLTAPEVTRQD